jgi:hypothetical protein
MKEQAGAGEEWTEWTSLDAGAPLLAIGTGQSYDELAGSLAHLQELGLMRFGQDEDGAMYHQVRADQAARMAALLDDHERVWMAPLSLGGAQISCREQ